MHLLIVSGRSGAGKSSALGALEDLDFYCIDNLPVALLKETVTTLSTVSPGRMSIQIENQLLPQRNSTFENNWLKLRHPEYISVTKLPHIT